MTNVPGLQNARDLGGTPVGGGRRIRPGALYRSDAPLATDPSSHDGVVPWPPRTVVDLRSRSEFAGPHPLEGPGTVVCAIPLAPDLSIIEFKPADALANGGMPELYRRTLAGAETAVAQAVAAIADAELPVLVHCAAGKDRTGILVAVILDVLGAERDVIVDDFVLTAANMDGVVRRIVASDPEHGTRLTALIERHPETAGAEPDAALAVLDALADAGGAATWLQQLGVPGATIERLRERLTTA